MSKHLSLPEALDRQLDVRASAVVEPGAMTGRVRVLGHNGGKSKGRKPPRAKKPPNPHVARPEPDIERRQVNVTMAPSEVEDLDAACALAQMPRSRFVAQALKHFYAKIFVPGWREIAKRRREG